MEAFFRKYYGDAKLILFPLLLIAFPLFKAGRGIDLADTGYSLGNYMTFGGCTSWEKLTFLSGLLGKVFTMFPFGGTLPGMRVYAGLMIGALAVLAYRFFLTKMPAWLAFLSLLAAEGFLWAPSVILYNYLTYVFFFAGAVLLFRALAGNRPRCLYFAGFVLGLNLFVRFPGNGLEVLLIFALWYYGVLRKKAFREILKETGLCVAGYVSAFILLILVMSVCYRENALKSLIDGTLAISGSASDYTFGEMIRSIFDAYLHGAQWGLYMAICSLVAIPFFVLFDGKWMKLRKCFFVLCIPVLFFVLGKWGMFNFRFYQKESALQWGAVFLLVSMGADLWMIASKQINYDWKLVAMLSFLTILITPLGSNNYIWPALNNLFLIAPVTCWTIYRFARWGRSHLDVTGKVPLFPVKAMLAAAVTAFFIGAVGIGCFYVFRDGEDGAALRSVVTCDGEELPVLRGTKTNEMNAANLSQLADHLKDHYGIGQNASRLFLVYGNIPGLPCYLELPCAFSTTWPDLDSWPYESFEGELGSIEEGIGSGASSAPVIIQAKPVVDSPDENDRKLTELNAFIVRNGYEVTFFNDEFAVFDLTGE
ncbi:MAG: hypothetical protein K6F53_02270 [Lachnospiraceae bacterium]|nr:hypothetical protein [Lachnospiraceae bacterium]